MNISQCVYIIDFQCFEELKSSGKPIFPPQPIQKMKILPKKGSWN